jgi:hypothetical protein
MSLELFDALSVFLVLIHKLNYPLHLDPFVFQVLDFSVDLAHTGVDFLHFVIDAVILRLESDRTRELFKYLSQLVSALEAHLFQGTLIDTEILKVQVLLLQELLIGFSG